MKMTNDKDHLKKLAQDEIERIKGDLIELSHKIHGNPEAGFKEFKASEWLCESLSDLGFSVVRAFGGLGTAFLASLSTPPHKPCLAIVAEYDALPDIGHACGHNIISSCAVGAAAGLAAIIRRRGGSVVVVGAPAEEFGGGKIILSKMGAFDGVDAAMMIHPSSKTHVLKTSLAEMMLHLEFHGRAAHAAAAPHLGLNALDAVIGTFNNISALRQQLPQEVRVHGIITNGGKAPNIIPDFTQSTIVVRTAKLSELEALAEKVKNCASGSALATGCEMKVQVGDLIYKPFKVNKPFIELFKNNLGLAGLKEDAPDERPGLASTDMGNVSHIVPAISPSISICSNNIPLHSVAFREAAISPDGDRALIAAAKAMAFTLSDLIASPEKLSEIKKYFDLEAS